MRRQVSVLQILNYRTSSAIFTFSKEQSYFEKLTGSQLVKNFHAFYVNRRYITAFICARHVSLSWASSIQSMPPYYTFSVSILILFSLYALVFQMSSAIFRAEII